MMTTTEMMEAATTTAFPHRGGVRGRHPTNAERYVDRTVEALRRRDRREAANDNRELRRRRGGRGL